MQIGIRGKWACLSLLLLAGMLNVASAQPGGERRGGDDPQGAPRGRGERGGFGGGFGGPGGFGGGFGGGDIAILSLMRVPEVRTEIKLTEDQQELVDILGDEIRQKRPEFPENFRELSDTERQAFTDSLQKWVQEHSKEAKDTLATILEPAQFQRLNEISLQTRGTSALSDPEVIAKLGLSDAQQTQLKQAEEANTAASAKLREEMASSREQGERFDFAAMGEKMRTLRTENDARLMAVLTADQKTAFEKMKGEAFEMPQRGGFGGGGFGGGGFGGGGRDSGRPRSGRPTRPE